MRLDETVIGPAYGNCPVQSEGFVLGHAYYFRARGTEWTLQICEEPGDHGEFAALDAEPYLTGSIDSQFSAGWMPHPLADALVAWALEVWTLDRTDNLRKMVEAGVSSDAIVRACLDSVAEPKSGASGGSRRMSDAAEAGRLANIEARRSQNAPSDAGKGSPRDQTALGGLARTEAAEEAACDRLIVLYHGDIVRLSQRRASKVCLGLPDRRYRLPPYAIWWELKKPAGQLTREQYDFLRAEWACGEFVGVGGIAELTPLVTLLRTTHLSLLEIRESSWHQVQAWADAFTFRKEPLVCR